MSQEQPRRPSDQGGGGQNQQQQGQGIRYGDVFAVGGDQACQPVAPQDASTMQSAENLVLGQTPKGGPASVMQSAATRNERMGVVGHDQATDITAERGITVSQTHIPGGTIITEFVAGQPVGQYIAPDTAGCGVATQGGQGGARGGGGCVPDGTKITIGEELEAPVLTAGDQPVEQSDAAAIQSAESRATGLNATLPGGVASQAQSAADANAWMTCDEDKTKLGDVLSLHDATAKLPADKQVERDDAATVVEAEVRNKPDATARPGGVAASMAAAARLNRDRQ